MKLPSQFKQIKNHSMGFELPHAVFQDIVKLNHLANQLQLLPKLQPLQGNRRITTDTGQYAAFAGLLKNATDARMSILHVKDRIIA